MMKKKLWTNGIKVNKQERSRRLSLFLLICIFTTSFICTYNVKAEAIEEYMLDMDIIKELVILDVRDFGAVGDGRTDDSSAIQAALDEARKQEGAIVIIPEGTYAIEKHLTIYRNTSLYLSDRTTLLRNAKIPRILINGDRDVYGYEGESNISIRGGVWDGNGEAFPTPHNAIIFGHAKNIKIENVTIKNIYAYHHIEFNAIKNGQIINCRFEDFVIGSRKSEAVQLDLMKSKFQFSGFGHYDNTACQYIRIEDSIFKNLSRGIGSHSAMPRVYHKNIVIKDNLFENIEDEAILALNYDGLKVIGNTFRNCAVPMRRINSKRVREMNNQIIEE